MSLISELRSSNSYGLVIETERMDYLVMGKPADPSLIIMVPLSGEIICLSNCATIPSTPAELMDGKVLRKKLSAALDRTRLPARKPRGYVTGEIAVREKVTHLRSFSFISSPGTVFVT